MEGWKYENRVKKISGEREVSQKGGGRTYACIGVHFDVRIAMLFFFLRQCG